MGSRPRGLDAPPARCCPESSAPRVSPSPTGGCCASPWSRANILSVNSLRKPKNPDAPAVRFSAAGPAPPNGCIRSHEYPGNLTFWKRRKAMTRVVSVLLPTAALAASCTPVGAQSNLHRHRAARLPRGHRGRGARGPVVDRVPSGRGHPGNRAVGKASYHPGRQAPPRPRPGHARGRGPRPGRASGRSPPPRLRFEPDDLHQLLEAQGGTRADGYDGGDPGDLRKRSLHPCRRGFRGRVPGQQPLRLQADLLRRRLPLPFGRRPPGSSPGRSCGPSGPGPVQSSRRDRTASRRRQRARGQPLRRP